MDRDTEAWDANLQRAANLPTDRVSAEADPEIARGLYRRLRTADSDESISATLDALGDGVAVETVWDALRLVASELFHRRSGRRSNTGRNALLPVHGLTVTNRDAGVLEVKSLHFEPGFRVTKRFRSELRESLANLAVFVGADQGVLCPKF